MDLRALGIFSAVADHLSFTRAAIALNLSQSHLTTQVQRLERELGAKLFHRRGRGITLTDRGTTLLSYARRLLALAREAEAAVRSYGSPALTIAAHESLTIYQLPQLLRQFHRTSPETNVQIAPVDEANIFRAARDGTVDVAFVYASENDERANAIVLGRERPVVVCTADLPMSSNRRLSISDMRRFYGLVTLSPCPTRASFDLMLEGLGISDVRLRELASVEAIKHWALLGLGYAVLPRALVAKELADGNLFELEPPATLADIFATLVIAPGKSTELNAFIEATRYVFAAK